MADRYQTSVREQDRPNARVQAAGWDDPTAKAWGAVGQGLEAIALTAVRRQEERDMLDAAAALDDYERWNLDYTGNPETGTLNSPQYRKAGARGLAEKYEADSRAAHDGIMSRLKSQKAKDMFSRNALKASMPYYKRTQDHEAREFDAERREQFEAGKAIALQRVLADPRDGEAFEAAAADLETRFDFANQDMSEEAAAIGKAELRSGLEAARISAAAADDPIGAKAMLDGSQGVLPSDRNKLNKEIGRGVESIRTQETVDGLMNKYFTDDPKLADESFKAALEDIRGRYEGEREDKLAAAFKQRWNENAVNKGERERALSTLQREYWDQNYALPINDPAAPLPSYERALQDAREGKIAPEAPEKVRAAWAKAATKDGAERRLAARDPEWASRPPEERQALVMRSMGVTDEDRKDAIDAILGRVASGELDGTTVKGATGALERAGLITTGEKARLDTLAKTMRKEQGDFIAGQKGALKDDIKDVFGKTPSAGSRSDAANAFSEALEGVDFAAPDWRKQVTDARRGALARVVEDSGRALSRTTWFGFGEDAPTALGRRAAEADARAAKAGDGARLGYGNAIELDALDLSGGPIDTGARNAGEAMLPSLTKPRKTGAFDDPRAYRNGAHNGVDYAAPEGTPVASPDIGVEWAVVRTAEGSKTAGTYAVLEGVLPDGRKVEMQVNHMSAGGLAVKTGDKLTGGGIIGLSGNTGVSTGPHVDVKMKIDGKYVDPDKIIPALSQAQARARRPMSAEDALFAAGFGGDAETRPRLDWGGDSDELDERGGE